MIKNWTVKNFKSIYSKKNLEFGGITLFAGANSSGKSTVLQSMLLATQTLQSQVISRPVVLNGHIVRLGTFDDILSNGVVDREVMIGFQLGKLNEDENRLGDGRYYYDREQIDRMTSVSVEFSFVADDIDELKESLQLQPVLKKTKIHFLSKDNKNNVIFEFRKRNNSLATTLRELNLHETPTAREHIAALDYSVSSNSSNEIPPYYNRRLGSKPAGVYVRHFMPAYLSSVYEVVEDECDRLFRAFSEPERYRKGYSAQDNEVGIYSNKEFSQLVISICEEIISSHSDKSNFRYSNLLAKLKHVKDDFSFDRLSELYTLLDAPLRDKMARRFFEKKREILKIIRAGRKNQFELTGMPLPEAITFSSEFVRNFFSERVKYLGPLRDEPKSVYPIAGNTEPDDIGFKGEHTAAVLDMNKNTIIEYYPTDSIPFNGRNSDIRQVKLQDAVLDWLSYMGIGERYSTEDKGKLGHELKISTMGSDYLHDLTHVGVGVSQVLPILVLALLAPKGSTLIFEQPELHLNPKVQTRLADFFASQMLLGKQSIIETHSEYIVSRLRLLSSESSDSKISDELKMYFVEKGYEGSTYRLVEMSRNGVIKDWPDGFFDESEKNSAAIIRSKLKRDKQKNT